MKKNLRFLAIYLVAALSPLTVHAAAGDLYETDFDTGSVFQFPAADNGSTKLLVKTGLTGARGIAFDRVGNLFISLDTKIVRITPQGFLTDFATNLQGPNFLTTDGSGNVYATDGNGNVLKFTPQGIQSIFATGLSKPTGLAFDFDGNLFVADDGTNALYKFTPTGARTTFAVNMHGPRGVAFDRKGNLYVANRTTGTVDRFTPLGIRTTPISGLIAPVGIVIDPNGDLFVAVDCGGEDAILKFTGASGTGSTYANNLGCPLQLAIEPPRDPLINISTRAHVETGQNRELIVGFILAPAEPKTVLLRALGPSLSKMGVTAALPDPVLELHLPNGSAIANDNWMDTQKTQIQNTGLAPTDSKESAILIQLEQGSYTATVRGQAPIQDGIATVEVYDLERDSNSTLINLSSRGFVQTGNDVMIAGFNAGGGNGGARVIIRALGPSLSQSGISRVLPDPTLELRDSNGALVQSNDDWADTQALEIDSTGLAPQNSHESAIVAYLASGAYTAIVKDLNTSNTGVALVEVYNLQFVFLQ